MFFRVFLNLATHICFVTFLMFYIFVAIAVVWNIPKNVLIFINEIKIGLKSQKGYKNVIKMIAGDIQANDDLEKFKKIADIIDISGGLETSDEKDITKIDVFLNNVKKTSYLIPNKNEQF